MSIGNSSAVFDQTVSSTSADNINLDPVIERITEIGDQLDSDIYTLISVRTKLELILKQLSQFRSDRL